MLDRKSQYRCKIDELAALAHPRDGHPKILVMLDAYLDESGIHDEAPMCVVAGYFAEHHAWRPFEKSWRATLNAFGIPLAEFHAKIILKETNPTSRRAVESLAKLISKHKHKIHPVSAAIVVNDFNSLSTDQRRFITGATFKGMSLSGSGSPNTPYYVPFQHCIRRAVSYVPSGGRAHFYVGIDRTLYEYATVLYEEIANDPNADPRMGNLTAARASETPQLQAADLLVHMLYINYPEFVNAHDKQTQLTSLPKGPQSAFVNLVSGNISSADQSFQDKEAIIGTLMKSPPQVRAFLHV